MKEKLTKDNVNEDVKHKSAREIAGGILAVAFVSVILLMLGFSIEKLVVPIVLIPIISAFTVFGYIIPICTRRKRFFERELHLVSDILESKSISEMRTKGGIRREYVLKFSENGEFVIPEENYRWATRGPVTDEALYNCSGVGDLFYLSVAEDGSGEIQAAYSSKYFEIVK